MVVRLVGTNASRAVIVGRCEDDYADTLADAAKKAVARPRRRNIDTRDPKVSKTRRSENKRIQ